MQGIIYKLTNLLNKRFYVGQHKNDNNDFNSYWGSGVIWLKNLKQIQGKFPSCWRKLIKREILWQGECNQKVLDKLEEVYIRKEKALYELHCNGCNILKGTANEFGAGNPMENAYAREKARKKIKLWWERHPEAKIAVSKRRRNSKSSEETKRKISASLRGKMIGEKNPMWGKKISEETRKKLIAAQSRRKHRKPHTEHTKYLISLSRKKYIGKNHPIYGKHFHWITNGVKDRWLIEGEKMPEGYHIGRVKY